MLRTITLRLWIAAGRAMPRLFQASTIIGILGAGYGPPFQPQCLIASGCHSDCLNPLVVCNPLCLKQSSSGL